MKGRSGYRVSNCKVPEVQERVTFLHPVCYQHDVSAMPPMVGRKFARGITYEKMGHEVDWARFATETNQRQRKRYEREKLKLDTLKDLADKSGQALKSKNWRKFKLVKVEKTEKGASNMINADDNQGDLGLEVSGKDSARSSSISGRPFATDLMTLVNILHLELEGSRHYEKDARSKRDAAADQVRSSTGVVDNFQAQLQHQILKGEQLAARDVKDDDKLNRQNMQVECIWSMLAERGPARGRP
jgi:hypothetical protein